MKEKEEKVEQLEEVETLEEEVEDAQPEQIVIEEEHHSKYDDVKPRTEMAEMSKQEQENIKEKVLGIDPKTVKEKETKKEEKLAKPSKKPNILLLLLVAVALAVIVFFITNMG